MHQSLRPLPQPAGARMQPQQRRPLPPSPPSAPLPLLAMRVGGRAQPPHTSAVISASGNISSSSSRSSHSMQQQRRRRRCAVVASAAAAAAPAPAPAPPPPPTPEAPLSFEGRAGLRDARGRVMLKNLTLPELEEWCGSIGEPQPRRRALQIWRWMYADGCWAGAPEDTVGVQNGLSARFCERIRDLASFDGGLALTSVARSEDGTRKLVFKLTEGEGAGGTVETVLIPVVREAGAKPRVTLCVSCQVGCAMACAFCMTGTLGLAANLSAAQIVEQMVQARRLQAAEGDEVPITNVVYMGMGETLDNLDAVAASAEALNHPLGLHVSHNKVTVSTVGLVDRLDEFVVRCPGAQLAVSLHATTDEVRDAIVPANRRHKLGDLLAALARLYPRQSAGGGGAAAGGGDTAASGDANGDGGDANGGAGASSTNSGRGGGAARRAGGGSSGKRRVLIEYVMLDGVNDTLEDAARLVDLLEPIEAKVNLITFNPFPGTKFSRTPIEQVLAFRSVLIRAGRVCTIRDSRGGDAAAACGQLGDVEGAAAARRARFGGGGGSGGGGGEQGGCKTAGGDNAVAAA